MKKILITGANGQLGTELRHMLDGRGIAYRATDTKELDITDATAVNAYFADYKPDIVYHCAAYTAVDKAEDEGKAIDELVNAKGTENMAKAAGANDATLIYISTDYVFDGDSNELYTVDHKPAPRNEYGRTKYEGEQAVQKYAKKYYIIRTSWVFGEYGHNFVYTMLNLAKTHDKLTVVNDQFGRPSWTKTLAEFMLFALITTWSTGFITCRTRTVAIGMNLPRQFSRTRILRLCRSRVLSIRRKLGGHGIRS